MVQDAKLKVYVPSQLHLPYTSIVLREIPNSIINSSHDARRRITISKSPMEALISQHHNSGSKSYSLLPPYERMVVLPFFIAHAYIDHSHNGVSQYSRQRALLYEINASFSELPGKKVFYNGLFYVTIAP